MTPKQIRAAKNAPHPKGTKVGVTAYTPFLPGVRVRRVVAVADGKGGITFTDGDLPGRQR